MDSCGLEESSHKAVPPSTRMEVLGIICDTDKLVLEIPDDKLKDIHRILLCWIDNKFAKLKEIQSFWCKIRSNVYVKIIKLAQRCIWPI